MRDNRAELLQIANRRTDGRNTFGDDVLLPNPNTQTLVNPTTV